MAWHRGQAPAQRCPVQQARPGLLHTAPSAQGTLRTWTPSGCPECASRSCRALIAIILMARAGRLSCPGGFGFCVGHAGTHNTARTSYSGSTHARVPLNREIHSSTMALASTLAGRCMSSRWRWSSRSPAFRSPVSLAQQQRRPAQRQPVLARASDDDAAPVMLTIDEAYKMLGVSSVASFDQILAAKNSMLAGCKGDQERMMEVSCGAPARPGCPRTPAPRR
jgi:hypothetical protein